MIPLNYSEEKVVFSEKNLIHSNQGLSTGVSICVGGNLKVILSSIVKIIFRRNQGPL